MTPSSTGRQARWGRLAESARRLLGRATPTSDAPPGDTLVALTRRLAEGVTRPVAVLVEAGEPADPGTDLVTALREVAGGPVVELDVADPSEVHIRLTALGPFAVIVDDVRQRSSRVRRFQDVVHHLAPGGVLVVRDVPAAAVADPHPDKKGLGGLLGAIEVARREGRPPQGNPGSPPPAKPVLARQDAWFLAEAIESVEPVGGHLVVTSRGSRALAKIGEDEIDRLVELRGDGRDRILDVVPAQTFTSRATFRTNATEGKHASPRSGYSAPAATLRQYHDVTCSPGQVVSDERVILPDTYRHNQRPRLKNRYTVEVAPRFAELLDTSPPTRLTGVYFHLDNELRGHFGHAMTEQVSRLWAWPRAKELRPDLKVLMALNKGRELRSWEKTLYGAVGITPEDIEFVDGPVQVETLLSATPMLSMPQYVHPEIARTWRRMSDALAAEAPDRDYPSRFFCARRSPKRACHNAEEVEALFAEQGFEILYPEEYSIPEQAAMFRKADVVAGYAGSALFNVLYAPEPTRMVMLTSEAYTASNEYMMASVLGHRIDLVTCRPDLEQPANGWSREAFEASYTFDPEREGRFLAEVFASLDGPAAAGLGPDPVR
ncbi:MAG: glycosyltransferase family 61 protein [Nocardioides sp.]